MTQAKNNRITRIANWFAIIAGALITILLPLGYFIVSYQHTVGSLEAEALINGRILSDIISNNPEYWRLEQLRLVEVLKLRSIEGITENRRIIDLNNRVIAAHMEPLSAPLITRKYPLKNAGIAVARIEISRSLLPLLSRTGILSLFSFLTGLSICFIVRILPFRALILAEDALQKNEERHRTILQTAMDGVCRLDKQGRFMEVNETYCRMSGYSEAELLTMSVKDVEAAETAAATSVHLQKVITEGSDRFESRHRHKNGGIIDLEISVQYKSAAKGEFVAFLRDISERKQAEDEHSRLQAQFIQAQKMESVGRLAGGVAHDFNNMLTVILGHTEIALTGTNPKLPLYESLQEIYKAADRSAELTRQLLAFASKQTVAPRVLDLNKSVEDIFKMLQRLIGENVELVWLPGNRLAAVRLDPAQLGQVLANLCVNAHDAIEGVGTITIETKNCSFAAESCADQISLAPGDYVSLLVSDTGCGMDRETLAHIFEPFFTTKELGKGTGLGLATVYGIVKQNNGFINVYSEPRHGTTFSIYLPRHTESVAQTVQETPVAPPGRGQGTVLLVEDEPQILELCTLMLENMGYRVLAAGKPADAIDLAGQHPGEIQLLLTDVIMPGMNGSDLATQLATSNPHLRQLFMSGYTADVIAHHGVLDKGVHFIQKPFSLQALGEKLREVLA